MAKTFSSKDVTFGIALCVLIHMGLVITPLQTPRRFYPLAQPLETSQKLGGRELVWRFDGGDITSDGGALVLKQLEERTEIVRRFAACFQDYRKADRIEHPLLDRVWLSSWTLDLKLREQPSVAGGVLIL